MKLKYITLLSFVMFVGGFVALAFYAPAKKPGDMSIKTTTGTSTSPLGNIAPGLTLSEVAKHSTQSDCYLIVNDGVYDVTSYINQHPGGVKNITSRCGTEATKTFSAIHSNFAWNLLSKFYLGDLVKSSTASVVSTTQTPENLAQIKTDLQKVYPSSEIVDIKPNADGYIAKVIKDNKLYEIHLDSNGQISKEEVQNDEVDWSKWDEDEAGEVADEAEYEDD